MFIRVYDVVWAKRYGNCERVCLMHIFFDINIIFVKLMVKNMFYCKNKVFMR